MAHLCQYHGTELEEKNYKSPYTCSGCKMQGVGKRYGCDYCEYVLHEDCMNPATGPISHPFFGRASFGFLDQPESDGRYCNACGKPIYGFNYHCREEGWDLHPCCRKLKSELLVECVRFKLRDKAVSSTCQWCNERRLRDTAKNVRGWSYVSDCKKYHFHVYCVSEMILESWRRRDEDSRAIQRIDLRVISGGRGGGGSGRSTFWRVVRIFLRTIVGILIGDPTALLTSFVELLIDR